MAALKVTAIIPVYNGEDYMIEALNSILNQTRPPDEIIMVDDASNDKTPELLKLGKGSAKSHGIKTTVITHKKNKGIGAARRTGCDAATGDYIAFCSADDKWEPEFIEEMLKAAKENPDTILYSDYRIVDQFDRQLSEFRALGFEAHEDFCIRAWGQAYKNTMWVNFSCVFIPAKVFKTVQFDPELRLGEDLKFLLFAMKDFKFKRIGKMLLRYMVHPESSTQTKTAQLFRENIRTRKEAGEAWKQKYGNADS